MDRSEPSLVPEWLRGAGGATHHVQPSSAHQGASNADYISPRSYSALSERNYYSAGRRGGGGRSSSVNERSLQDWDPYSRGYTNFVRSPVSRTYEATERIDRDAQREWDWDRDRNGHDRDRASGFGGVDDLDRDQQHLDTSLSYWRPGLGPNLGVRHEVEPLPLRRSQSMTLTARALENGEKKMLGGEQGGLPSVLPATSGSLTSSMQKAAFERNFPSLGAQDRGASGVVVQPNLGHVAVLSPRPLWQGPSTTRLDGTRSSTLSPGLPSSGVNRGLVAGSGGSGANIGAEGWSSALAEAPSALMGGLTAINGTSVADPSITSVSSVSSGTIVVTTSGTSANPTKMVDALVQNPPRFHAPPQQSAEKQRLEELALKQSRQLIPMKPSLPKNMGLSPREKLKPKVVRTQDVVTPPAGMKVRQPVGSSASSSPYRLPASQHAETPKVLAHKMNKEIGSVLPLSQPDSALKSNSSPLGPISVGVSLGSAVGNASGGGGNISYTPRKQKQLLDRHALPIPSLSLPAGSMDGSLGGIRPKDGLNGTLAGTDDRRPPMPTQNRVDFFNALRKKASVGAALSAADMRDQMTTKKSDFVNGKELVASLTNQNAASPEESTINGVIMKEGSNEQLFETEVSANVASGGATASEEEEAAFLRSLGWEENAEDGEEALTEEEISAFYQERMRLTTVSTAMQNSSNHHNCTDLKVGSVGNLSSGMSTSDSESDDDRHVYHSKTFPTI
ncbi:unnamed protein product [Sphagnum troendelagicum]|uniref:Uncharacterized protein n=1 Tax=Sphagnum troendelagicum TaxID=128251 RepID=A0ABP0V4H4_9BRYO